MSNRPSKAPDSVSHDGASTQIVEYLQVIWKRKWPLLAAAILGGVIALMWTKQQPRIYQADCTIEYDPNPPKPVGREVDDLASPMVWWETREYFATQNKILTSRAVAEKVVRKLSLAENMDFWGVPAKERAAWKAPSIEDTAQYLRRMITVSQERETRLVHVMVKDRSAERAALLANSVADAYIDKTMQDRLGATTGALEWLGGQLDTLKRQLEQSELSLHEFSEQHSKIAVSLEDQQNIVAGNIEQLSKALTDTRMKRIAVQARLDELKAANVADPLQVHAPAVVNHLPAMQLRDKYRSLLTAREELTVQYGDAQPKVIAVNAQLATVIQQLRAEIDGLVAAAQSDLNEVQKIERGVNAALDQANKLGLELNLQEISYRRLQRERDNTSKLYGALLERTAQTDLTRALQVMYVRIVDRALVPHISVSPRLRVNLAVGTIIGLLLGLGLALLLDQLDRTIRSVEDAEALGLTILGVMPKIDESGQVQGPTYARRKRKNAMAEIKNRDLIVHTHPKSSVAECCRTIRTNLTFMSADTPRKTMVVTSASPREGKSTVTISLAISLAQGGKRVLIVDTDLRKPRIHRALGRPQGRGVTSILVGAHSIDECLQDTEVPGLSLLASGPIPPNPSELLHTAQFGQLVHELAKRFDQVIFDSPPLTAVTDAAIIAPQVDGAILVIHGQETTRDALRSALRQLHDVNCHITGGVLNDVDLSSRQYGYGTYYYYHSEGYYAEEPSDHDGPKGKRAAGQA